MTGRKQHEERRTNTRKEDITFMLLNVQGLSKHKMRSQYTHVSQN